MSKKPRKVKLDELTKNDLIQIDQRIKELMMRRQLILTVYARALGLKGGILNENYELVETETQ